MATNWKIVDGNLPYEDNFFTPIPNTSMSDADAPYFFYRITDGDLPFRNAFHSVPPLSGTSSLIWNIIDGDYPFKWIFPEISKKIDYTSDVLWQISDSTYPYKKSFPQMMGFTDVSDNMWIIQDGGYPYKRIFPEMPKRPRRPKKYKGKHQTVIIPVYKQTVIVNIRARDPQTG